jgi:DASH complex subunit DAM1
MMAAANRTPLRRVSQGSLSALARSQSNFADGSSTGLEFLAPAMGELAEEMEMIATNLDSLNEISDSLDSFNEAFASYLYVMKMNTLCVEWPEVRGYDPDLSSVSYNNMQAPTAASFLHRIEERKPDVPPYLSQANASAYTYTRKWNENMLVEVLSHSRPLFRHPAQFGRKVV